MSEQTTTLNKAKPIKCVVTSDKMSKSRVGMLERLVKHPRYGKYLKRRTKLMFHDETNMSSIGDVVLIKPSKPMSRHKKFVLVQVVQKAGEQVQLLP